jgi:hypothetical protein
LLAPRMLWPLDCFVARAPRNDGWVAADPIDSVVIGRRLSLFASSRVGESPRSKCRTPSRADAAISFIVPWLSGMSGP